MFTQPNFFFIGGMRCGSTSLNLMLEQHPDVYMSHIKEPYYYTAEAYRNIESPTAELIDQMRTFEAGGKYRTDQTYQSLFMDVNDAKIVGESSHYIYHPDTAAEIFKHCPEARILVSLRNPVDRLFSEFLFALRNGSEAATFSDYVEWYSRDYKSGDIREKSKVPKLNKGLQSGLLAPWIAQFGQDRVKLVLFDDLNHMPVETMMDIFRWLQIDTGHKFQKVHAQKGGASKARWLTNAMNSNSAWLNKVKTSIPKSARIKLRSILYSKILERPDMDEKTRQFLWDFYQDDVKYLSEIIGRDLSQWGVIK